MPMKRALWSAVVVLLAASSLGGEARAWGNSGHRMIGLLAARGLPADLPPFLRAAGVDAELAELSREPDRSRGAGKQHDSMRDPGHFIDVDDNGLVLGGPRYDALPPSFTDYETALRAAGTDSGKAGFLPYTILDGWQQLAKDFALWRVADYGVRTEKDAKKRAWLVADRASRQRLIVRDLGVWSHYVGDTSYPLHVSVHYNGWGDGPNPQGFTTQRIHVPIEGPFVGRNVRLAAVRALIRPYQPCGCPIEARLNRYIAGSVQLVEPFYALEKAGGFKDGDPRGSAFLAERLAVGAMEVRDMTIEAWKASATASVGYPIVTFADVKAGKVSAYDVLYSSAD